MNILLASILLAAAQAPVDHSQHNPAQHAQHQQGQKGHEGEHKCCKEVNGKMECQMMKGHAAPDQGKAGGHAGHGAKQ